MSQHEINMSLEFLILNDLLRTKAIDKDIYDKAIQFIKDQSKATTTA